MSLGKINIKPFKIGKYSVTNKWFEEFVRAGGYSDEKYWTVEGRKWLDHTKAEHPSLWNKRKWRCPNSNSALIFRHKEVQLAASNPVVTRNTRNAEPMMMIHLRETNKEFVSYNGHAHLYKAMAFNQSVHARTRREVILKFFQFTVSIA